MCVVVVICLIFCCKQKTAYERRISDWSSDVCSSDLTPFLELDDATFDRVIAVNLKGVFHTGQEAARRMVARGIRGVIVNIASVNAVIVPMGLAAYNASKGAVNQLTKTMAVELAGHGIRVNAIGPGSVANDMFRAGILTVPEATDRVGSRHPPGPPRDPHQNPRA